MTQRRSRKNSHEKKESQNTTSIKMEKEATSKHVTTGGEEPSGPADLEDEATPKHTIKDSVFRHLFSDPRYGLQLYRVLHPEDTEATEKDITYLTIIREITNGIRSDLGMYIGGRYLILIEAQTTWSVNILVRMFIYLAETWKNYIAREELDVFSSRELNLPVPEFYVVYTGSRKKRPEILRLSEDLFHGRCKNIELVIRMLYNGENEGDILSQYVAFTEQASHFYKTYGRTRETAEKLLAYCIEHDILKEYLSSRKEEVMSMQGVIFDDTIHRKKIMEKVEARAERRGERRGEARGRIKGELKQAQETALRLYHRGYDTATIAEIVDMPVEKVDEWLSGVLEKEKV